MKTRRTIDQMLAEHPFFQGFAPEHLRVIAGCAQNAHFKADTYPFREGEPASNFYVLRNGKVALEINIPGSGMVQCVEKVFSKPISKERCITSWVLSKLNQSAPATTPSPKWGQAHYAKDPKKRPASPLLGTGDVPTRAF